MELVVDANILFAALISDSHTRHILLSRGLSLCTPDFFFEEFEKHVDTLKEKSGLSRDELCELMSHIMLMGRIQSFASETYRAFVDEAKSFSPDPADIPYLALALCRKCAIWSNDKKLKEQKQVKIYSTQDLAE